MPKLFPSKPDCRVEAEQGPFGASEVSRQDLAKLALLNFPRMHGRAHDPKSYSHSDGSAVKKGSEPRRGSKDRSESSGTITGTGLVMAQSQRIVHIDPGGKDTTNKIVRAELVGVQAWLQEIMKDELEADSTFRLLTDSQVTLYSINKAITEPASSWLNTHESLLRDIVNRLKNLTDAGHHIDLGKVKAHMGFPWQHTGRCCSKGGGDAKDSRCRSGQHGEQFLDSRAEVCTNWHSVSSQ